MGDEVITVGEESVGGGERRRSPDDRMGTGGGAGAVELPVVDLLTGRGFITGTSGSGKSNTVSVVAEKLLDQGYGLLVVDVDGEYYGLKEEYEVLHVGGDDECDLQVGVEHAEKLASLALERGVSIVLDVSSFLDERDAHELLKEVAKHLFAKEKKLKQPFLLLVEECHEFIPESAGMDECGRMLVRVGKRGRKHGLGIVGISQRPADVKRDFITQCDWLVWHRLTWSNDTRVAGRILGSDYRNAVEDLGDGECFLVADWERSIRRVQMERKRTFDAGATPGLDDFERPGLKSVSSDLMVELERISDREVRRESRLQQLELELKDREERITELERELEEARDLSEMAERFSRAMIEHASGRPFRTDVTGHQSELDASSFAMQRVGRANEPARNGDSGVYGDAAANGDAAVNGRGVATESAAVEEDETDGIETPDTDDFSEAMHPDERPFAGRVRREIASLDSVTRGMLAYYREYGPASPLDAHVVAGGEGQRTEAYRRNGILREANLIEHAGRGDYVTRLRDLVAEAHDGRLDEEEVAVIVESIVDILPPARPPEWAEGWPDVYETGTESES